MRRVDFIKETTRDRNLHHIAQRIFKHLDQKSVIQARGVSRLWLNYVDTDAKLWDKVSGEEYVNAVVEGRTDIIQRMTTLSTIPNPSVPNQILAYPSTILTTPLHIAAMDGRVKMVKMIASRYGM